VEALEDLDRLAAGGPVGQRAPTQGQIDAWRDATREVVAAEAAYDSRKRSLGLVPQLGTGSEMSSQAM
jgi:hypothetical protein